MQNVIRRTALARNQAARKLKIQQKQEAREEVKTFIRENGQQEKNKNQLSKEARLRRTDDWLRGSIAPKVDSGLFAETYGTAPPFGMALPKIPKHQRKKYINFAKGDRVAILKGIDKGKIGVIDSVDPERESVTLKNHNIADVSMPQWLQDAYSSKNAVSSVPISLSINDIRLVVTLEENGTPYEAIAKHVIGGHPFIKRPNDVTPRHTRYIKGEGIPIPWPNEDVTPTIEDNDVDSLRQEVEHETYVPSMQYAPFESTIIDELRNKYSKYRTRHDPEWVKAKKMEDLKKEYLATRAMLTPQSEQKARRLEARAEARKALIDEHGNYKMSKESAAFIESYMTKQKSQAEQAE
ncbi:hypothetical protein PISL3812_02444 [Talaromyces islandicus]|uniref:KOW domain-containing protein n=1 Tax=Talaromyces islandicus TaxID=28573 RepID=A0A0U1LRQ1_TALIS|nr:hypothetical protein PISL3812_02444 [Talaromyces islandicus]